METPKEPTAEAIREYVRKFEAGTFFVADTALSVLFAGFPKNNRLEVVLLKVAALNSLYATGILAVEQAARHIHGLDIDSRLQSGSVDLVNEIAVMRIGAKERRNYSFATKYCGWHVPDAYPLYDSFSDNLLWAYQRRDGFARFARSELLDYPRYKAVLDQFRVFYGLTEFSYKQIDNFLWLHGKECFPYKA